MSMDIDSPMPMAAPAPAQGVATYVVAFLLTAPSDNFLNLGCMYLTVSWPSKRLFYMEDTWDARHKTRGSCDLACIVQHLLS